MRHLSFATPVLVSVLSAAILSACESGPMAGGGGASGSGSAPAVSVVPAQVKESPGPTNASGMGATPGSGIGGTMGSGTGVSPAGAGASSPGK